MNNIGRIVSGALLSFCASGIALMLLFKTV